MGTRFLPATKAQPKEMLLVVDRPVIQYVVEEGLASGADEVVIVNSRDKKSIEKHFSPDPELVATLRARGKDAYADEVERVGNLNVSYVYQDEPLGLGHAIHCAAEKTADEPFFVLLGDVIVPDGAVDALVERAVAAAGIYPQLLAGSGLGLDLRARIHGRGRDVDLIGVRAALEREARLLGHVFMPVLAAGDGVDDEQMFHSSIPALSTK